jgi:outer membrane protein TolC
LAEIRYDAVKQRIRQGDMAVIDSVETLLEVQRRQVLLQEAYIGYLNARIILSNHLWTANGDPLELDSLTLPDAAGTEQVAWTEDSLQRYVAQAARIHPDLLKQQLKNEQLAIDRKLQREFLKPTLNVGFNVLDEFPSYQRTFNMGYLEQNNKFGVQFYTPLFLRKERGKYKLATVKLRQGQFDLQLYQRQVGNQVRVAFNEVINLGRVLDLQQLSLLNYQALLQGEQQRFRNGESTVFLVNQRERALIENEVKFRELQAKFAKAKANLWWSIGQPGLGQ